MAKPKRAKPRRTNAKARVSAKKKPPARGRAKPAAPRARLKKPITPRSSPPAPTLGKQPKEVRVPPPGEGSFALDRLEDDDIGEELGEDIVRIATGGSEPQEERDEVVEEEEGGPFVTTTARVELATGTDGSNPADAEVAPLPNVLSEDSEDEEDEGSEESE